MEFNTTQRHLINHEIDLIETSPHIINAKGCFFSVMSFKINHSLTSKLIQTYLKAFLTAFRPRSDPKRSRNISIFEYSELNISKAHQRTIITAKKSHGTLKNNLLFSPKLRKYI